MSTWFHVITPSETRIQLVTATIRCGDVLGYEEIYCHRRLRNKVGEISTTVTRPLLRTCLRPGSSRFELSRHVDIARTCSNLVADRFEAKCHYAILVADRSKAGRRPVVDLL